MAELLLALRLLLALILYAFLGFTLYTLWRELRAGEAAPSTPAPSPAMLFVEAGDHAGRRLPLQAITAIGRAGENTLALHDPFASAHHALVLWREGQWWLEDLASHNGTYFNGERMSVPLLLTSGDRIRIGETVLRFEMGTEFQDEG